jgi:cellulose synthase/poly-beta-1,6-N-acetylglucosamine synthase-like glycosyltransferase
MNEAFQNERVVAAGGTVHITQSIDSRDTERIVFRLKNLIRYQVIQYLIAFYLHKFTQSRLKSLIVVSGAYGAFKRSLLLKLQGYRKTVGEDMDITLKIQQYIKMYNKRYLISFVPQSVCYTECPESFMSLMKQRIRWQKAFIDCTFKYGTKMFRRFKTSLSFFFIFDYLILGTLTSFLFFLLPLFLILGEKISVIFFIIFGADLLLGIVECLVSKRMAARYNHCFSGMDNLRVGLFVPFKIMFCKLLNLIFVIVGTFSYFISRERWNKAERLGRCFSGTAEVAFSGESRAK